MVKRKTLLPILISGVLLCNIPAFAAEPEWLVSAQTEVSQNSISTASQITSKGVAVFNNSHKAPIFKADSRDFISLANFTNDASEILMKTAKKEYELRVQGDSAVYNTVSSHITEKLGDANLSDYGNTVSGAIVNTVQNMSKGKAVLAKVLTNYTYKGNDDAVKSAISKAGAEHVYNSIRTNTQQNDSSDVISGNITQEVIKAYSIGAGLVDSNNSISVHNANLLYTAHFCTNNDNVDTDIEFHSYEEIESYKAAHPKLDKSDDSGGCYTKEQEVVHHHTGAPTSGSWGPGTCFATPVYHTHNSNCYTNNTMVYVRSDTYSNPGDQIDDDDNPTFEEVITTYITYKCSLCGDDGKVVIKEGSPAPTVCSNPSCSKKKLTCTKKSTTIESYSSTPSCGYSEGQVLSHYYTCDCGYEYGEITHLSINYDEDYSPESDNSDESGSNNGVDNEL